MGKSYRRPSEEAWIRAITQGNGSTPLGVIEDLLCEAWGKVEADSESAAVGTANGAEIIREIAFYMPATEEGEGLE